MKTHKSDPPTDPNAQGVDGGKPLSAIQPFRILQEAIRAVPAVKYALGVAGIVAAIAIVSSFGLDFRIAVFGTIITFVLMVLLVIFAKLSTAASGHFVIPVLVLMWSFLILTIATALLLFSSVFFKTPIDLQGWIKPRTTNAVAVPDRVATLPARQVLITAYNGNAPRASLPTVSPKLEFEISAMRQGATNFTSLQDGDSLASETEEYLIVARPLSPGFLYIFQVDSSGNLEWFFPRNNLSKFSDGSNPVAPAEIIQLPASGESSFYLDKNTGVEHIYAVFSAVRWPELEEALLASAASASSTMTIQQANGLGMRGVGGTRVHTSPVEVKNTLSVERKYQGKTFTLPITTQPLEATGSVLVLERWFKHVAS